MRAAKCPVLPLPITPVLRYSLYLAVAAAGSGCGQQKVSPLLQIGNTDPLVYLLPFLLLGAIVLGLVIWWFLWAFTGRRLETDPKLGDKNEKEIERMVKFCYVFPLLYLLAPVLPFGLILLTSESGTKNGVYIAISQSPIGFVLACVVDSNDAGVLSCGGDKDPYPYQWVLNIGGSVFFVTTFEGPQTASSTAAQSSSTAGSQKSSNLDYGTRWLPAQLHGGLAVPWYVLIVSIMGGAVGMLRRIPEYQRRALDTSDESLSPAKAREFLVFEIVQVTSAPLIAITAYNLLTLESRAAAVGVAFASGFSSEAVLLAIRGFTDRLIGVGQPTVTQPAPTQTPEVALTYQEDDASKTLKKFWKPDDKTADTQLEAKLKSWLKENSLENLSITSFIFGDKFADARVRAIKELRIGE